MRSRPLKALPARFFCRAPALEKDSVDHYAALRALQAQRRAAFIEE